MVREMVRLGFFGKLGCLVIVGEERGQPVPVIFSDNILKIGKANKRQPIPLNCLVT